MGRKRPTKHLYPPKPKGPTNPKRRASMEANRLVTVTLTMRHYINGKAYGPGKMALPHNLATGLMHTEGHAIEVEDQFRGAKAAIIGPRRAGGHVIKEVPEEMFDTEYAQAGPADVVKGGQFGNDTGGGSPV